MVAGPKAGRLVAERRVPRLRCGPRRSAAAAEGADAAEEGEALLLQAHDAGADVGGTLHGRAFVLGHGTRPLIDS